MSKPIESANCGQHEWWHQREQQLRQDQQGAPKPGFDKDQIPQGGSSDNGPMTAPEDE